MDTLQRLTETRKRGTPSLTAAGYAPLTCEHEKILLVGIREEIRTGPEVDFVVLEFYRCLRSHLDKCGWPARLERGVRELKEKSVQASVREAVRRLLPQGGKLRPVVQRSVERDIIRFTARQIAWLQTHELLRTGAVVWPRFEPTNGEIRALRNQIFTPQMRNLFRQVRDQWGTAARMLDIDLSYLSPVVTKPKVNQPFDDYHEHMRRIKVRDVQLRLIRRVCHRLDGH